MHLPKRVCDNDVHRLTEIDRANTLPQRRNGESDDRIVRSRNGEGLDRQQLVASVDRRCI